MNLIKEKIKSIILESSDPAVELITLLDDNQIACDIPIEVELQNVLLTKLVAHNLEEEVWNCLLQIIKADMLSEDVFSYLLHNKIAIISLCHMQLKDEWLEQLCSLADEPIFTLARRYYLQESYSASDFIRFYNDYLVKMNDVSLHLLDIYKNAKKRRLLLELCLNDSNFIEKEIVGWHVIADQIKTTEDSKEIEDIFQQYSKIGIILLEISNNSFTPKEILYKLSVVKGISYAGTIRKNSKNTLKLKKDCNKTL